MEKYTKVDNEIQVVEEVIKKYNLKDLKARKQMLKSEKEAIIKSHNSTIIKYDEDIANLQVLIDQCKLLKIVDGGEEPIV